MGKRKTCLGRRDTRTDGAEPETIIRQRRLREIDRRFRASVKGWNEAPRWSTPKPEGEIGDQVFSARGPSPMPRARRRDRNGSQIVGHRRGDIQTAAGEWPSRSARALIKAHLSGRIVDSCHGGGVIQIEVLPSATVSSIERSARPSG